MAFDSAPVAHVRAVQDALSIGGGSWTEAVVTSGSRLENRKWVQIYNRSPYKVYYSYSSSESVSDAFALRAGAMMIVPLSDSVPIYLQSSQATGTLHIIVAEVA